MTPHQLETRRRAIVQMPQTATHVPLTRDEALELIGEVQASRRSRIDQAPEPPVIPPAR